ncbi:MAG: hypothetical protein HC917_16075 [Richelia sp. SM2_1_7]|nr:hypothetical protein [Richelia sp. SM2_1_7]
MSLTNIVLLTLVNTVTCLVLPKTISSVFSVKSKPKILSETTTIALKKQAKTT